MKLYSHKRTVSLLFCLVSSLLFGQTVTTNAQLETAINNATAGSTIILANGVWTDTEIDINKVGTATNPIIIKAESPGQVFLEGNVHVKMGGNYIILEGLVFQNASNLQSSGGSIDHLIEFRDSSNNECFNCVVTNIKIDAYNGTTDQLEDKFKWIFVLGQNNEISHSSFLGKYGVGSIINDNRTDNNADFTRIHHNYFAGRIPVGGVVNEYNDQDAIRIGVSTTSMTDSFTEVYDNLFEDWSGEVEIISNKSGKNKYYNNTFRDYQGTLTLRHGNDCEVYNNFFFANNNLLSGGIRVIGEGHTIYNNYITEVNSEKPDGTTTKTAGAINISNGRENSALSGYFQVKDATIVNNTFVNCDYGLRVGTNVGGDLTLAPEDVIIANNIMLNTSDEAVNELTAPIGNSIYEGNITQNGAWDLTNGQNNNQTVSSGLLESGPDFYTVPEGSPAIDAAVGTYDFLTRDILNGLRDASPDAGAEEFAAGGTVLPYDTSDVGVSIGFLSATSPFLLASVQAIGFPVDGGNISLDITSNIDWSVQTDAAWLTVNTVNGSNDATVVATASTNDTGVERTATITILQNGGDLEYTIVATQSDGSFDPGDAVVLTDITVTGEGTQEPNVPENTIDGDFSTRWSANGEDGSVYLTYDLQCPRIVTSVAIYFHQGDQRVAYFQVATSEDGVTFENVTEVLESSGDTVGFEYFDLTPNPTAQFVRILGFGNSTGSGWNSYEEVQIEGDANCASLSTQEATLANTISVYPVPTKDNYIYVQSRNQVLGLIQIYDLRGTLVLEKHVNSIQGSLNISKLARGMYLLKTPSSVQRIIVQ